MDSTFCQGCPLPVAPFKGYLNITQDGLEVLYSCESGYEIRKNYEHMKSLKRKCLKHGHWEGFQVPNCVRKFGLIKNLTDVHVLFNFY